MELRYPFPDLSWIQAERLHNRALDVYRHSNGAAVGDVIHVVAYINGLVKELTGINPEDDYIQKDALRALLIESRIEPDKANRLNLQQVHESLKALFLLRHQKKENGDGADRADATAVGNTIPTAQRTRPMSLREAAKLMGYTRTRDEKQATKMMRAAMDAKTIKHIKLGRQQHVFDRRDFPKEAQNRL